MTKKLEEQDRSDHFGTDFAIVVGGKVLYANDGRKVVHSFEDEPQPLEEGEDPFEVIRGRRGDRHSSPKRRPTRAAGA